MGGLHLILAGAAVGNGNRGIEALAQSVIDGVERESTGARLTLLDDGWGVRPVAQVDGRSTQVEYAGVRLSRRWYRPESWAQIRVAQALAPAINPVAARFSGADAVLDLSAGDSFTDLYGTNRLATVSAPKDAARRAGRPLVLLPQTYGPFRTRRGRDRAARLVRSAALAYARDAWSYDQLGELAGPDADPSRLLRGVDVAFALEPRRPAAEVADLLDPGRDVPTAGVNVSGLLGTSEGRRFGLAGDYLATMAEVVRGLVATGAHVLLVPHVHVPGGGGESDLNGVRSVLDRLDERTRARATVLPPTLGAAEVKWCIGQLDWFVGSRMHATIAALSSLTPATAYAYSDKTLGVFQSCGMGQYVVDARRSGGDEASAEILDHFARREQMARTLAQHAPATIEASRDQLRYVLDAVARWRGTAKFGTIA